jgi:hypothetical protein
MAGGDATNKWKELFTTKDTKFGVGNATRKGAKTPSSERKD